MHGRIYAAMTRLIERGMLADHLTLKVAFDEDEALRELDGAQYLARLARAAETIINAGDYGRVLHDLGLRRGLIHVGEELVNKAYDPSVPESGREQIEMAEQQLFKLAQEGEFEGGFRDFPAVLTSAITMVEAAYHKDSRDHRRADRADRPRREAGRAAVLGSGDPRGAAEHGQDRARGHDRPPTPRLRGQPGRKPRTCRAGNYAIGLFSLEMSAEQLAMRLLSAQAELSSDDLRRGKLRDADFKRVVQASQELASRALYIDDTPALSVAALRTRARRLKRRHGLSALVVDYLQLVRPVHQLFADQPGPGDRRDHPGPESDRQGAQHPRAGALAALARGRAARGQAADALGPARIRRDRAGRRRRDVHLSRRVLSRAGRAAAARRPERREATRTSMPNGSSATRKARALPT